MEPTNNTEQPSAAPEVPTAANAAPNVITPTTPDSPPAATESPPGGIVIGSSPQAVMPKKSFFGRLKNPALLMPLAAIVILGAGSAAAYFGYYVPNQPQNVLAKSFQNTLAQHQATSTGSLDLTSSGVSSKVDYTVQLDADAHALDANLKATISGVDVPVELLSSGGNLYIKVGDLSTLEGLVGSYLGAGSDTSIKPLEDRIVKTVTNQWIVVDSTLIKEAKLDCLGSYPAPFSQSDIQSLTNSYKTNPFITITNRSSDTFNGAAAYKYQLSLDDDTAAKLNLNNSDYFKKLSACLNQDNKNASASLSSLKDGDKTPLTLWVDKKTKLIVGYASASTAKDKAKGTTGSLSGKISYGKVSIKAPANAKPVLNLVSELGLGDLAQSFTDSFDQTTTTAKDTERKTDIVAMQGHLEAYFADNGYYPTLSSLNNAAWRAANLKGLDPEAFKDPDGTSSTLSAKPAKGTYSYVTVPVTCDNGTHGNCNSYTLTATLDDGSLFAKQSLNSELGPSSLN
jgi:hypothetical protein